MYEAYFCCTMRLAEGLLYVSRNKDLLWAFEGEVQRDEKGRYMAGDIIYAEISCATEFESYIDRKEEVECDGIKLQPIIKYYDMPKEVTDSIRQKVIF